MGLLELEKWQHYVSMFLLTISEELSLHIVPGKSMAETFDLNIENILEHWGIEHALREIIANALDEQSITNTENIKIDFNNDICIIRDYGRGLNYTHFTQKENDEKLSNPKLIGKFGVGLKDALAVFYRHGVDVVISSRHATIRLVMENKAGFDIKTLHALFESPKNPHMRGTEFVIRGVTKSDVDRAKSLFLIFNNKLELLERTRYGEVYSNENLLESIIYANGVQIAKEPNFLFSYNITAINTQMKKALNRERSNVGRTAYSEIIRNVLKNCRSNIILNLLIEDAKKEMLGTNHDESDWVDVAAYAFKTLSRSENVVFMTPIERNLLTNEQVEILTDSGKKLVMVNDSTYSKISSNVQTFETVNIEYHKSFSYHFINDNELTRAEKEVYEYRMAVIDYLSKYYNTLLPKMKISETIMVTEYGEKADGVWDSSENAIIIKRSILNSVDRFLAVSLHEYAHFLSGYSDNTRGFENMLTEMLGHIFNDMLALKEKAVQIESQSA